MNSLLQHYDGLLDTENLRALDDLTTLPKTAIKIDGNQPKILIPKGAKLTTLDPGILYPERINPNQQTVGNENELIDHLAFDINDWLESGKMTMVVAVGGPPGIGKSSSKHILEEAKAKAGDNRKMQKFDLDRTFRTGRESPLRKNFQLQEGAFHLRYHARDLIRVVLPEIVRAEGEEATIFCDELYNREHGGKVEPGIIHMPGGRRLLWIDGVGSEEHAARVKAQTGVRTIIVSIVGDDGDTFKVVCGRDVKTGARTPEEAYKFRKYETGHLGPYARAVTGFADYVLERPRRRQQYSALTHEKRA